MFLIVDVWQCLLYRKFTPQPVINDSLCYLPVDIFKLENHRAQCLLCNQNQMSSMTISWVHSWVHKQPFWIHNGSIVFFSLARWPSGGFRSWGWSSTPTSQQEPTAVGTNVNYPQRWPWSGVRPWFSWWDWASLLCSTLWNELCCCFITEWYFLSIFVHWRCLEWSRSFILCLCAQRLYRADGNSFGIWSKD